MTISDYCKSIRLNKGINVYSLSKELGCSHSYILNVESGKYDEPTPLVLAKIVMIYKLDFDNFISSIDNIFSDSYIEDVKRHMYKNLGTKIVFNRKNVVRKFYNDYLSLNGYTDIKKESMVGNVMINNSRFNPFSYTDDSFVNLESSIEQGKATIFPEVDYVCSKDERLCFICVLDITSTIMVNVDKEKVTNYVDNLLNDIMYGYFETNGSFKKYDVIMLTPSEKIYDFIIKEIFNRNIILDNDYRRIAVALSRPKRPIKGPTYYTKAN